MDNKAIGVLGVMADERSMADQMAIASFGCSVENYDVAMDGVMGPSGYNGERSSRDQQMLAQFCGTKECASLDARRKAQIQRRRMDMDTDMNVSEYYCPYAKTSDNPFNPYNNVAKMS
jgi:hypothetical protein